MKRKRLGDVLKGRGELSADTLQKLFDEQHDKVIRLGELILERGLVEKSVLTQALEEVSGIPYLDCSSVECDPDALRIIPAEIARRLTVLPIGNKNSKLVVAMAEPQNLVVLDELRFISSKTISPRFGFVAEIIEGVKRNYGPASAAASSGSSAADADLFPEIRFVSTSTRQANREAIQEVQAELNQKKTPAVRLVSEIIQQASVKQASDIHIEPQSEATIEEIARVVPLESVASSECAGCGHELLPTFHYCPTCGIRREESALSSEERTSGDLSNGVLFS